MAKITDAVPSFIGGISDQPVEYRSPDQVTDMLNCYPSLALGVARRPPFTGGTQFNDGNESDRCAYHFITGVNPEDPDDFHVAVVRPREGAPRAYAKDGSVITYDAAEVDTVPFNFPVDSQRVSPNSTLLVFSDRIDLTDGHDDISRFEVRASLRHQNHISYTIGATVDDGAVSPAVPVSQNLSNAGSVNAGSPDNDDVAAAHDYSGFINSAGPVDLNFEPQGVRLLLRLTNATASTITLSIASLFSSGPTVTFGEPLYLETDDPRRDLRFLTVRNRVYIVNTAVTVAQSSTDPNTCLLYTSPSPRDRTRSRMPSSA